MNAWPIRNTATRRHSIFQKHSLFLKISVNKEPWCFHCNQKFASLFKKFKSKENNIKSNNKKENNIKALKKNNIIYVQGKKEKRKENVGPPLKIFNQTGQRDRLWWKSQSIHGPSVPFVKLRPYLLVYTHLYQPEGVEGAQTDCPSYNWPFFL